MASSFALTETFHKNADSLLSSTQNNFRLRNHVEDSDEYKILTTLPTEEALLKLAKLDEEIKINFINALRQIYSYALERNPALNDKHFLHIASAVYYEEATNSNIKGKNHYKKAGCLTNHLTHIIEKHQRLLDSCRALPKEQRDIIIDFNKILEAHLNLIKCSIDKISPEKKGHLTQHCALKTDTFVKAPLSPKKTQAISELYPANGNIFRSPTPTDFTEADKKSIAQFKQIQNEQPKKVAYNLPEPPKTFTPSFKDVSFASQNILAELERLSINNDKAIPRTR